LTGSALKSRPNVTSSRPRVRVGSQTPRLRSVPAYSRTAGDDAVALIAAAGQPLDEWQANVVRDILAMRDDGTWAAFETCLITQRQNGKGAVIEALELAGLFLFGEQMILHSAHEYKTAQEAFLRIKSLIDGCRDLRRHVKSIREANGEQQVILLSGARLRFVARSKGSGRGFSGQRNILDEAYALTRTQLAALLPTMSAQPNPQVNLFSTAPDVETMPPPEEASLLSVRERALTAIAGATPGRLAYHEWSPPDGADVADADVWYECNPALGIRISEEYVASELAALGPEKFAVERLGVWPRSADDRWRVVSEERWLAAQDTQSQPEDPLVFGVAVYRADGKVMSCIGLAGVRRDGDLHVEVPQMDHRSGTGWVVERAKELHERWRPARWAVDASSPAGALIPDLEAAGLPVEKLAARHVAQAYGLLVDGMTRTPAELTEITVGDDGATKPARRVWHRDDPRLTVAMASATSRPVGSDGSTWDSRTNDLTPLLAVSNALWGLVTLPDPEPVFFAASWR